ncbi:MAG: hypothetical protein ACJ0QJ_01400 [Flavobacteriales bacterium]
MNHFCQMTGAEVMDKTKGMTAATHDGITMINFGMGSPNAATVMDLLTAIDPDAVLFFRKMRWFEAKKQNWRFNIAHCSYTR